MSNEQNKREEEVDLGALFIVIGKGFIALFNVIGSLFKQLFHFLIQILLFLKLNILKIGLAALIGAILGIILEVTNETRYVANLQVQPNFSSSRQLYNNVNYYNDLVKQKDTTLLAETFQISIQDAASLKKFQISPVINENDILNAYDGLIKDVDTLTVRSYSFDKFKNMFTTYDYKIHNVEVFATKNDIFPKLDQTIIEAITENEYFKKLKEINNEHLTITNALIRKNLSQADSLHNVYKKVLLEEAQKENSGTSIDLAGKEVVSKELELFNTNRELNKDLKKISDKISEKSEIVNIISNFQPIGHEVKEIEKNRAFQLALLGAVVMILGLLLIKLNKYLDNYKR